MVNTLTIEQPKLALRHLGEGRYDVDDVLTRLRPKDAEASSDPALFALFTLTLSGGELVFVDDSVGATHKLTDLTVGVPFLSNLPSRLKVVTQPRLAFVLNGSAFDWIAGRLAPGPVTFAEVLQPLQAANPMAYAAATATLSAITAAPCDRILDDELVRGFVTNVMREAAEIARRMLEGA